MPVHTFFDDKSLLDRGKTNYWGYDSIGLFSLDPRYSASGMVAEFKQMVAHFHDAGLEVILDVVYNHTAEGNELGPTALAAKESTTHPTTGFPRQPPLLRQRYRMPATPLNLSHPRVLQMMMDSLRYWVMEMHVDGFRFDLGHHSRPESCTNVDQAGGPSSILQPGPGAGPQ